MPRPTVAYTVLKAWSRESQKEEWALNYMGFTAKIKINAPGVGVLQRVIAIKAFINPVGTTFAPGPMQKSQSIEIIHAQNLQKHAQNVHCGI